MLERPESAFHAAVAGWKYPLSREAMLQLEHMDLLLMHWLRDQFKPLDRPWSKAKPKKAGKSPAAAMRQLRPHLFHNP